METANVCFSIIMPCYNSSDYVRDAVNSLLNQTYSNWELIAVNDGSTDETLGILDAYAKQDDRIKVYSKKNGGYATAINYGLDRITGDYFLLLGSDDRLSSDLFQEIVNGIGHKEPDLIAFRSVKYRGKRVLGLDSFTDFDDAASLFDSSINEYDTHYPQQSRILFVRDTAKCFKTSLLGDLRYFGEYGVDADGIFSTLFAHKCHSFVSLPIDGYFWTIRGDSVSVTMSFQKCFDRLNNWKHYYAYIQSDKNYLICNQEKSHISAPFYAACDLLRFRGQLSIFHVLLIHNLLRQSIVLSKKCSAGLMDFNTILNIGIIKRFVFQHFPILFLFRYGFVHNVDV